MLVEKALEKNDKKVTGIEGIEVENYDM